MSVIYCLMWVTSHRVSHTHEEAGSRQSLILCISGLFSSVIVWVSKSSWTMDGKGIGWKLKTTTLTRGLSAVYSLLISLAWAPSCAAHCRRALRILGLCSIEASGTSFLVVTVGNSVRCPREQNCFIWEPLLWNEEEQFTFSPFFLFSPCSSNIWARCPVDSLQYSESRPS